MVTEPRAAMVELAQAWLASLEGQRHPVVRSGERQPIPSWVRWAVWERDGRSCRDCGGSPPMELVELDHIVPWSAGGSDRGDNLRVLCDYCNQRRSNFRGPLDKDRRQRVAAWCIDCMDRSPVGTRPGYLVEAEEQVLAYCVRCGVVTWAAPEFSW